MPQIQLKSSTFHPFEYVTINSKTKIVAYFKKVHFKLCMPSIKLLQYDGSVQIKLKHLCLC